MPIYINSKQEFLRKISRVFIETRPHARLLSFLEESEWGPSRVKIIVVLTIHGLGMDNNTSSLPQ